MKNNMTKLKNYFKSMSQTDRMILLIAVTGVIIRLIYIQYTGYAVRQHDSVELEYADGHQAYILYLYNHLKFPDFDPRLYWQFYHPPLHHIIAAVWLKLNVIAGFDLMSAFENLQILTTIYSCATAFLSLKIFKELGIKGRGLVVAFAIVCLHPTLILMSGSLNNDILCLMLEMAAILATLQWYKKPTMKNIIKIAVFMGLSMMTKTSGALIAPAIAFVFLYKFVKIIIEWKNSGNSLKKRENQPVFGLIKQFISFLVIAVPIGMWWSIYSYARFKVPFGYVPKLSNKLDQYLGSYPDWKRFIDFDLSQVKNVFENWGNPGFEHTIPIAVLKTSIFGEYDFSSTTSMITGPAVILFWLNVILVLISVVAMLYVCFKKLDNVSNPVKIFLALVYSVTVASYIKFCFEFAFVCTMDFRYIVPTLIIGALSMGLLINELEKMKSSKASIMQKSISLVVLLFAVFGVLTYFMLAVAS